MVALTSLLLRDGQVKAGKGCLVTPLMTPAWWWGDLRRSRHANEFYSMSTQLFTAI